MMELPRALESEQAVLGAILNYKDIISEVIDKLKEEDFYYTSNLKVYRVMKKIYNEGLLVDIPTLSETLNNDGMLKDVGGVSYLIKLYEGFTLGENIRYHCEIIKDKAIKRNLINLSREISRDSFDLGSKGKDLVGKAVESLYKMLDSRGNMFTLSECVDSALLEIEKRYNMGGKVVGAETGFKGIDMAIGGLQKGNLLVVAGRPSMGKTALALNIASNASKENKVAIFSFEMTKEELTDRLLSDEGSVVLGKIKSGKLSDDDLKEISKAAGTLSKRYAFIYDGGALTVNDIRAKCMKAKLKDGLDIVVIDYLQLIKGGDEYKGNRVNEITQISRDLKNLAKELKISVVAISQLSRATEGRIDKRPVLSDLRDSGSIEQDADIIVLLYRDEYYNKDSNDKGKCEIIIGKNRNGRTGTIKLNWLPELQRFNSINL